MKICMVNHQPFYSAATLPILQQLQYQEFGLTRFLYQTEFAWFRKEYPDLFENAFKTLPDKVQKSREVICGIYANGPWKGKLANFFGWHTSDFEIRINTQQNGIDAIAFNFLHPAKSKNIELKHTNASLYLADQKNLRGNTKGRPGIGYKSQWKFHCSTGNNWEEKEEILLEDKQKYRNSERFLLGFTFNEVPAMLGFGFGIIDAWAVPGPETARLLSKRKGKSFPVKIAPTVLFRNPNAIVLEKLDVDQAEIYNFLAS